MSDLRLVETTTDFIESTEKAMNLSMASMMAAAGIDIIETADPTTLALLKEIQNLVGLSCKIMEKQAKILEEIHEATCKK